MIRQSLPLDPITEGDEWDGIIGLSIKTGPDGGPFVAPESPLTLVTMRFKKEGSEGSPVVELSSDVAGQITITNAAEWEFTVLPQIIPELKAGMWAWQIRLKNSSTSGKPQTYFADTLEVLETI